MKPVLLCLAACAGLCGCLERKIQVTSEPPGATVYLNDTEVGRTPLTTGFRYHGVYDVRLRKDGYEPLSTHKRAREPIWEVPPFDLAATAMPWTFTSDHEWHFRLEPAASADPGALVRRAQDMKAAVLPSP